jgi:AcrR family transcriptional regulator
MGIQPLTRTQRARRSDIVDAAIAVLSQGGFAAASVERIAREAATSKGTVLYHFGSKEGVLEEVVRALYEEGGAHMTKRIMAASGARARLHAYLDSNLRFIASRPRHITAVHRILENQSTDAEDDTVGPLRAMLTAGQESGELGTFDAEVVALMIRAIMDGASFYFSAHPNLDLDRHIAEVIRVFDCATAVA